MPARSPEVVAAAASYEPRFGSLGADDARRAQVLIGDALSDLGPSRVQVNRSIEQAIQFLRSDTRMPTAFDDDFPDDPKWAPYMERRRRVEVDKGIHGVGEEAGRTVYGGVQVSDVVHPEVGAARINTGVTNYGEVSLVLRPEVVAARTSFLPNDSFYADAKLGAAENLPDVVLERVLRNFKVVRERSGESSPWLDIPAATLRQRFSAILSLDDDSAKHALREHLVSDAFTRHYIEAQVRGLTPTDIAEVRVETSPALAPPWRNGDARGSVAARAIDELRGLAESVGASFRATDGTAGSRADAVPRPLVDVG